MTPAPTRRPVAGAAGTARYPGDGAWAATYAALADAREPPGRVECK